MNRMNETLALANECSDIKYTFQGRDHLEQA